MFRETAIDDAARCRKFLRTRGFLALRGFVAPAGQEALLAAAMAAIAAAVPPVKVFRNSYGDVVLANKLDIVNDDLFELARDPTLLAVAAALIGRSFVPMQVEYFNKPQRHNWATPAHQDQAYYDARFKDVMTLSFWMALDDAGPSAGCLEYADVVPSVVVEHATSAAADFALAMPGGRSPFSFSPMTVRRGDCIVHHAYAVHRARENTQQPDRRAVAFNFREGSASPRPMSHS